MTCQTRWSSNSFAAIIRRPEVLPSLAGSAQRFRPAPNRSMTTTLQSYLGIGSYCNRTVRTPAALTVKRQEPLNGGYRRSGRVTGLHRFDSPGSAPSKCGMRARGPDEGCHRASRVRGTDRWKQAHHTHYPVQPASSGTCTASTSRRLRPASRPTALASARRVTAPWLSPEEQVIRGPADVSKAFGELAQRF